MWASPWVVARRSSPNWVVRSEAGMFLYSIRDPRELQWQWVEVAVELLQGPPAYTLAEALLLNLPQ